MRLPRWLSSVRTVEAETGWPKQLCEKLVQEGNRPPSQAAQIKLLVGGLVTCGAIALFAHLLELALGASEGVFVMAVLAGALLWVVGVLAELAFDDGRFARRFMLEPWCLNCKYPVCPPREPGAGSICPECGEPIAPEIARLAARDAEATERISE
ncbi:MAG: hypothetical protein ACF8R7_04950 [Phycisphaerales bacterium JB039]